MHASSRPTASHINAKSSTFSYALGLILFIGSLSALIASLFLEGDDTLHTLLFGISFGGFLGAGYMLKRGNWSKSSNDRPES
jgi:L-asparagine transporter-like permease